MKKSYVSAVCTDVFPKKEQAITIEAKEGISVREYTTAVAGTTYSAMPMRTRSQGEGTPAGQGAVVPCDAIQKEVQETLLLQAQETERRLQEAMRRQEEETERRLQEAMQRQEEVTERRLQEAMQRQEEETERRLQEAMQRQEEETERRLQKAKQRQEEEKVHRLQEAMQLPVQEAEHRLIEAVRVQEQRAATALPEAVAQRDQKLQEDGAIPALQQRVERMNEVEAAVERRADGLERSGEEGALQQVKGHIKAMEGSLQWAMQTFFPRMDDLLRQLEGAPPQGAASSSPSLSPSPSPSLSPGQSPLKRIRGEQDNPLPETPCATSSPFTSTAISLPESTSVSKKQRARSETVTGRQEVSGAVEDEQSQRLRVELRMQETKERVRRTRAAPSQLGEDLLLAAWEGRIDDIRRLLDAGADVNCVDGDGTTPLMRALMSAHRKEVVSLLLERGADVTAVSINGRTAMHRAGCWDESGLCVDLLVAAGGDVNARDRAGFTPLHWAADENHEAAVRALLSAGARRDLKSYWENMTPFDVARPKIKHLLRL